MKIRKTGSTSLALTVVALALWIGASGCATKGFVRNEMATMQQQLADTEGRLTADIAAVSNSTAEAMARADLAFNHAGDAHDLALGKAGFEEVGQYTVYFDFDDFELTAEAVATLREAALLIHSRPEYLVDVYGFTDATGGKSYNYALGQKRAESVVRYLVDQNPGHLSRFAAVSYGENKAIGDKKSSRRVVVSLITRVEPNEDVSLAN